MHRVLTLVTVGVFLFVTHGMAQESQPQSQPNATTLEQQIDAHIADLASDSFKLRLAAATALEKLGPQATKAIPALIEALDDRYEDVYSMATHALVKMGASAVPALIERLRGENKPGDGVTLAVIALSRIGAPAKSAETELLKLLAADQNLSAVYRIPAALANIGADPELAVPALIKTLSHEHWFTREEANRALARFGLAAVAPVIAALDAAKARDQWPLRLQCVRVLSRIAPQAATEIVPVLIRSLKDSERLVVSTALDALGNFGVEAKPAVLTLIEMVKAETGYGPAAATLGRIGPEAREAVPVLVATLKHDNAWMRIDAARSLGQIGAEAKLVVPALLPLLSDSWATTRGVAVEALGRFAAQAGATPDFDIAVVVTGLVSRLGDGKLDVEKQAYAAVIACGTHAIPTLCGIVDGSMDASGTIRNRACKLLGELRLMPDRSVLALTAALKSEDLSIEARLQLGKFGAAAKPAVPVLIDLLKTGNFKDGTLRTLQGIGLAAKEALPAVVATLTDRDQWVRYAAVQTLRRINADTKEAVLLLMARLDDTAEPVRGAALTELGHFGSDAAAALDKVRDLAANDPIEHVRRIAANTVKLLAPDAEK